MAGQPNPSKPHIAIGLNIKIYNFPNNDEKMNELIIAATNE